MDDLAFVYNTVTSIEDVVVNVSVFPNPSLNGRFNVDLSSINGDVELVVYNLYGRIIQTQYEMAGSLVSFDIEAKAGMYLLSVNTGPTTKLIKIIKR
ncbi:MAG: hypothetical protein ACI85F_001243 [Bacteroidia bacterium]